MRPNVEILLGFFDRQEALVMGVVAVRAGGEWVGVGAVKLPVQAVGGLTIEQAVRTPEYGAPLVVLGAPLTVDADSFKTASGDLESSLRLICEKVHSYGDVRVGKR